MKIKDLAEHGMTSHPLIKLLRNSTQAGRPKWGVLLALLLSIVCVPISPVWASEPWADTELSEQQDLVIWLDASRDGAARKLQGLPPLEDGSELDRWHDASEHRLHLGQPMHEHRPRLHRGADGSFVRFRGSDFLSVETSSHLSAESATVFVVAAPAQSSGKYDAFLSFNRVGVSDYQSGMNIDLGGKSAGKWQQINIEGAGQSGEQNLLTEPVPLNTWHVLSICSAAGTGGTTLFVDGNRQGQRSRTAGSLMLDQITIGARYTGNPPGIQGFFTGDIAEILIFGRSLGDEQRKSVETYLAHKHAGLLNSAHPQELGLREKTLEREMNPPLLQMLVPGFTVRELPVNLTNINNVAYAPDGRLFAGGYDGRLHVLRDTDGDGLEDSVKTFYDKISDDFPLGMTYQNDALYVLRRHHLAKHIDTDGDGVPDREEVAATGWRDEEVDKNPLYTHRRVDDALGLAIAEDGTVYVSMGAANFSNAYLRDKEHQAHVDLAKRRGCVLRIPPNGKPEVIATGVRFLVSMQFNKYGDLFATDQEGATWMPNGNPFDELLQIQTGRHYGFPPRHPIYLPNVIDEPSVFDYSPQHQSTCGFRFNEARQGWSSFGPPSWEGDAFVTGESRGKLFRTKLVKTANGYVAQNQLIGCLSLLPIDVAISPKGDLVVACHSGAPDWGSGPSGQGKLFKISYSGAAPRPTSVWPASPTETRVEFDKPLDSSTRDLLTQGVKIEAGKYITAGERFESFRPGYAVVKEIQQRQPRYEVPVTSASVSDDGKTLVIQTAPRQNAMNYIVSLPLKSESLPKGALPQIPVMEFAHDLSGVEAEWQSPEGQTQWSGWLPDADLTVAHELTRDGAHTRLWELLQQPGKLRLKGQLNLRQMLHPAVQPGSKLDYDPSVETVTVSFVGNSELQLIAEKPATVSRVSEHESRLELQATQHWTHYEVVLATGKESALTVSFHTNEDNRERAMMLRRFQMTWAKSLDGAVQEQRSLPELAGGNWEAGKALFTGQVPGCVRCHTIRGEGGHVAPDLSNLVHRDYESVMKDIRQPSAAINPDYLFYLVKLQDGKALSGIVVGATDTEIQLGDATGQITTIARSNIRSMNASKQSMMPEGLLDKLSPQQIKDLMTFLLTDPPATH